MCFLLTLCNVPTTPRLKDRPEASSLKSLGLQNVRDAVVVREIGIDRNSGREGLTLFSLRPMMGRGITGRSRGQHRHRIWGGLGKDRLQSALRSACSHFMRSCCKRSSRRRYLPRLFLSLAESAPIIVRRTQRVLALPASIQLIITAFAAYLLVPPRPAPMWERRRLLPSSLPFPRVRRFISRPHRASQHGLRSDISLRRAGHRKLSDQGCRLESFHLLRLCPCLT